MRTTQELSLSAWKVLGEACNAADAYPRKKRPRVMVALFSGGHDSICACHVASRFRWFDGVTHIDTGIGAKATREHVEAACSQLGWKLRVLKSPETYEQFVRLRGFPGPGMHQWAYVRLKERCVRVAVKGKVAVLVTGCRRDESTRRMGTVEPVKVGEQNARGVENRNRVWTAPCFDWTAAEQAAYMEEYDLPRNPLKATLGMSGECFCGAFARPGEIDLLRRHCPDVAAEIDRLAAIARECGRHAVWGTRPDRKKGLEVVQTGPLCTACDRRAWAAGVLFKNIPEGT